MSSSTTVKLRMLFTIRFTLQPLLEWEEPVATVKPTKRRRKAVTEDEAPKRNAIKESLKKFGFKKPKEVIAPPTIVVSSVDGPGSSDAKELSDEELAEAEMILSDKGMKHLVDFRKRDINFSERMKCYYERKKEINKLEDKAKAERERNYINYDIQSFITFFFKDLVAAARADYMVYFAVKCCWEQLRDRMEEDDKMDLLEMLEAFFRDPMWEFV